MSKDSLNRSEPGRTAKIYSASLCSYIGDDYINSLEDLVNLSKRHTLPNQVPMKLIVEFNPEGTVKEVMIYDDYIE